MSAQGYEGQRFEVTVWEMSDGWRVVATADGAGCAEANAPTIDLAMTMAMAYMTGVCMPDPVTSNDEFARFERALRGPSAPDGPKEAGQ